MKLNLVLRACNKKIYIRYISSQSQHFFVNSVERVCSESKLKELSNIFSLYPRSSRMGKALDTSLPFAQMEPEAGRKRWWLQQTRPCISTEMRLSPLWRLLKWRLESTTTGETGRSAKLSSFTPLRAVSWAPQHEGIFFVCFCHKCDFFSRRAKGGTVWCEGLQHVFIRNKAHLETQPWSWKTQRIWGPY